MNLRILCALAVPALLVLSPLFAASLPASEPQSFVIADNAKPVMAVVVPRDFGKVPRKDAYVAEVINSLSTKSVDELVNYVEIVSGARLPVITDGEPVTGGAIHIGATDLVKSSGIDTSGLKWGGYVIAARGDNILIFGKAEEGASYGIYGFLRDYIGVRWFMPGDHWEVTLKKDRLEVKVADAVYNPDFEQRDWPHVFDQWVIRNRLTPQLKGVPYFPFGHNLLHALPVSKYGKDHPEYYPEWDGERHVPEGGHLYQPCFTNSDVIRITVEAIQKHFEDNPEASQYSLCVEDSLAFCLCKGCAELDSPYRTHRGLRSNSDSYYYFVDKVAREIAKSNPGKTLGCYAYICAELPPRRIKRLPNNVVIMITQDTSQYRDPEYKRADREMINSWSKVASRILKYDYYGLGWFSPRYYPQLAAEDLKYSYHHNTVGHFNEVYAFWAITSPQLYVCAQLLWDVDQDPDALLDEYFDSLYENVAPTMKGFYAGLEQMWMQKAPSRFLQGLGDIKAELLTLDPVGMNKAQRLLDKAYAESSGVVRKRVDYIRKSFKFSYLTVNGYDRAASLKDMPVNTCADVDRLAADMKRVLKIAAMAERTHAETFGMDNLYRYNVYYRDACYGSDKVFSERLIAWETLLTDEVKAQLVRIREWAKSNMTSEDAEAFIASVESQLTGITIRHTVDWRAK